MLLYLFKNMTRKLQKVKTVPVCEKVYKYVTSRMVILPFKCVGCFPRRSTLHPKTMFKCCRKFIIKYYCANIINKY